MTPHDDCKVSPELLERIAAQGLDALPELIRLVINAAMRAERERHLGVDPYERSPERNGHANGFKPKTVKTRMGAIAFDVPQVREGGFYPQSLEKGLRSERALKLAFAEMVIQGVSTRNVAPIIEKLCGFEVSSSAVSRAVIELDPMLSAWRNRPLGEYRYVFLDARYEQCRVEGVVRDVAVLTAVGVGRDGKREVLGVSVSLSEAEVHWREFLVSLKDRGLGGVRLIVSDDHAGLKAARLSVFGGVPWQRCQVHLQANAQAHVPKQAMKPEVVRDLRTIFNAPDRAEAEAFLAKAVAKYAQTAPKLSAWMEANIPEGLTVFGFPEAHRRKLRTNNGIERPINQEILRRTRVVRIFPNEASCLRLVTALVMEISEEWQTGRTYLTFDETH
jgi:putative transposase